MLNISDKLKEEVKNLNQILNNNYKKVLKMDKDDIRCYINNNIGKVEKLCRISTKKMEKYKKSGGVVAVDGSKNRIGSAFPHFIELFQSLAKSSIYKDNPIYIADFYTPLYMDKEKEILEKISDDDTLSMEDKNYAITKYKLAAIEVDAAIESIDKLKPFVIMMDGSLIRYKIECADKWNKLKRECEKNNVILIGVIKDIKTNIISMSLEEDNKIKDSNNIYDRELLYGVLEYGEIIRVSKDKTKKTDEGFTSCFMRTSKDPSIIGMDIISSQKDYIEEMANLVFTLTPQMGRGIPLWLDIIDSEVKISDKVINGLLERYLDRDIREKLFVTERSKREF
ncbi:DNA double-strand break repair nuclease NurA [Dethiothermospora halolimnae]|uniref:DNA double-strand break repair nuclease NurA n=1 Tax=Dethiothermospora halolimnae TaxID=3114390 RepID=UPI003CCB81B6